MRIALLDPPSYSPAYDHHLASALGRRGNEVELLTAPFAHGDPPAPDGYRRRELFLPLSGKLLRQAPRSRLRFLLKGAEYVPSVLRLVRAVNALQPDVVHVQWVAVPRYDLRWLGRLRSARPLVLTAHNVAPHLGETDPEERRRLYTAFDRVVVHTPGGAEQLARYGVPEDQIAQIPHGTFNAPRGDSISAPQGRTLLFFGLIRRYKGLLELVHALAGVPDTRLIVAGDPVDSIDDVRKLARRLDVDERIDWRLGYLPAEDVGALMREATLTVFPYVGGESASGALATALGHGRPAVVTEVLGDTVAEYGAGAVVPAGDPRALADAINRLLDDREALHEAFRGTERARRGLSWDTIAEAHERLYADLLARVERRGSD